MTQQEHTAPITDPIICRCEEIRKSEILQAIEMGCRSVTAIKKYTRAGMGVCQGRTCARLIEQILIASGISPQAAVARDKARFPIVPCPISAFNGSDKEDQVDAPSI
ncbi:MAG: (2Fe-2S)-binding protein [Christensenellaceae bacterium]|jgi:sarcosine oxidase subunit beta|nr:(2Fe-2S)-binding protein [Christensenellaceae bacterium]